MNTAQMLLLLVPLCAALAYATAKDLQDRKCTDGVICSSNHHGENIKELADSLSAKDAIEYFDMITSFNDSFGNKGENVQNKNTIYHQESETEVTAKIEMQQVIRGHSLVDYELIINMDILEEIHFSENAVVYQKTGSGNYTIKDGIGLADIGTISVTGQGTQTPLTGKNLKFLLQDTYKMEVKGHSREVNIYMDLTCEDSGYTRLLQGTEIMITEIKTPSTVPNEHAVTQLEDSFPSVAVSQIHTEIPSPGIVGSISVSATGIQYSGEGSTYASEGTGYQWYSTDAASLMSKGRTAIPQVSMSRIIPITFH